MCDDGLSNRFPKLDGNGIADEPAYGFSIDGLSLSNEFVSFREALQNCAFTQGNRSVLFGVPETTVTEPVVLRSHGGRRHIPFHAAIDAGISFAATSFVTIGNEPLIPVPPSAARDGRANAA